MSDISVPTIHLNGSDGNDLLAKHLSARTAIREAALLLEDAQPHPRDYPDTSKFVLARQAHSRQLAELKAMENYLYEIIQGIQDQLDAKERNQTR